MKRWLTLPNVPICHEFRRDRRESDSISNNGFNQQRKRQWNMQIVPWEWHQIDKSSSCNATKWEKSFGEEQKMFTEATDESRSTCENAPSSMKWLLPWTIGRTLQIMGPNMKFRCMRAIIVKGIKHARSKSAHAKFIRYLLFVNRIGPREPNMTTSAAVLPRRARTKITSERPVMIHSPSLLCDEWEELNDVERELVSSDDELLMEKIRHDATLIVVDSNKNEKIHMVQVALDQNWIASTSRKTDRETKKSSLQRSEHANQSEREKKGNVLATGSRSRRLVLLWLTMFSLLHSRTDSHSSWCIKNKNYGKEIFSVDENKDIWFSLFTSAVLSLSLYMKRSTRDTSTWCRLSSSLQIVTCARSTQNGRSCATRST